MLALEQPKAVAAIASALCAELYDLEILAEGIEDHEANHTRFLLISRQGLDREGDKCSIVFAVPHRPGALYQALRLFAEAGINLTRIASIPRRTDPGNYTFFLDFEGSERSEVAQGVLAEMEKLTTWLKVLGSYPSDSVK
jgi:prephenate dehydratase